MMSQIRKMASLILILGPTNDASDGIAAKFRIKLDWINSKNCLQGCHSLEKSWIFAVLESPWKYLEGFPCFTGTE